MSLYRNTKDIYTMVNNMIKISNLTKLLSSKKKSLPKRITRPNQVEDPGMILLESSICHGCQIWVKGNQLTWGNFQQVQKLNTKEGKEIKCIRKLK